MKLRGPLSVVLCASFLTSCAIIVDSRFLGNVPIAKADHQIELETGSLVKSQDHVWYVNGGGLFSNCFLFVIKAESPALQTQFRVLSVRVTHDKSDLAFSRFSKPTDEVNMSVNVESAAYEIWALSDAPDEFPAGSYHIRVHYELRGREYDAEWNCLYRKNMRIGKWPSC